MKDDTRKLFEKAERALRAAQSLLDIGDAEFAAGRAYYAMLFVAEALLYERGQGFSKHGAVQAAFGKEFAKTGLLDAKYHRWLIDAFDMRLQTDYQVDVNVSAPVVETMIEQAREFLAAGRRLLERPANSSEGGGTVGDGG